MATNKKLKDILNKAKHYPTERIGNFSAINGISKSFGIELIEKENDAENSILFESINQAKEEIYDSIPIQRKITEKIAEDIKKGLDAKGYDRNEAFRILFHLS